MQSRLESAARSASIASVNASDAHARVVDTDIATTMGDFVQAQIRQQASISILVQANSAPAVILQLLK
jgi:flagellin